jgi:hypothetical protein
MDTVIAAMERIGIEPMTSSLQRAADFHLGHHSLAKPHDTAL